MTYYYPKCEDGNVSIETIENQNAFALDFGALQEVKNVVPKSLDAADKAKAIFDYFAYNFSYKRHVSHSALDVFNKRLGACGELSLAYTSALRVNGIESYLVEVAQDCNGKNYGSFMNNGHACSSIHLDDRIIYADLAYKVFDVHHIRSKMVDDEKIISWYPCKDTCSSISSSSDSSSIFDDLKLWHLGAVAIGSFAVFLMIEGFVYSAKHSHDWHSSSPNFSAIPGKTLEEKVDRWNHHRAKCIDFFDLVRKNGVIDSYVNRKIDKSIGKFEEGISNAIRDEDDEDE